MGEFIGSCGVVKKVVSCLLASNTTLVLLIGLTVSSEVKDVHWMMFVVS